MNVNISEASAYKLWKRLSGLQNDSNLLAFAPTRNFFGMYLSRNPYFVGARNLITWKVMVKINLADLIINQMASKASGQIDEYHFHRLWQLMHLENMSVFFEKVIELIDENAPQNGYLVSSQRMFSALCSLPKMLLQQTSNCLNPTDFLHYLCYFYCGTSPGFLHKHEATLLLQDLCRDWHVIYERIFNFCDPLHKGEVDIDVMKDRCPTLMPADHTKLCLDSNMVKKDLYLEHMLCEYPPFIFNYARITPLI